MRSRRARGANVRAMARPTLSLALLVVALGVASCSRAAEPTSSDDPPQPSSAPTPESEPVEPTAAERAAADDCGNGPGDWCASPPRDACGEHRNAGACSGDPHCEGRPYTGESFVACQLDARCFATNCPTVGCVRRCEELTPAACRANAPRCSVVGSTCVRRETCLSAEPAAPDTAEVPAPDEGG